MAPEIPSLSVIVPWCDRAEIALALRHNGPLLAAADAEVVVSNCGGDEKTLDHALSGGLLRRARVLTVASHAFNKSLAVNLGASLARAPWLAVLDADVLLDEHCLEEVRKALHSDAVVTVSRVFESARPPSGLASELTDVVFMVEIDRSGGPGARIETNRIRLSDGSRSGPGLAFMARAAFVAVGGMNSELAGWGWEDIDLLLRLQLELNLRRYEAGAVTHLTHADAPWPASRTATGEAMNLMKCVANYAVGNFQGSYESDNATWKARATVHELA